MGFAEGARKAVLAAVLGLVVLAAPAPALEPDEATDYLQNPARTGSLSGDWLEPPLVHRWTSEELGSPISFPLIAGDRVFVTAQTSATQTALFSFDRATGDVLWSAPSPANVSIGDPVIHDSRVFAAGSDNVVRAFAAESGELLWSHSIGTGINLGDIPPLVVRGRLLAGLTHGGVLALDADTGAVLWGAEAAGTWRTPLASDGRRAYSADGCGNVIALDVVTGAIAWRRRSDFSCGGWTFVAVHGGLVYVEDSEDAGGLVLDADTGGELTPLPSGYLLPTFAGDVGLFPSGSGQELEARDLATDEVAWDLALPAGEPLAFPPLVVGDDVYVAREPGELSGHDLGSGAGTWTATLAGDLTPCCIPLAGFAAGQGTLVAPSGTRLEAYGAAGPDTWIEENSEDVSSSGRHVHVRLARPRSDVRVQRGRGPVDAVRLARVTHRARRG